MASQFAPKANKLQHEAIEALARTFNTLDIEHIKPFLTESSILNGDGGFTPFKGIEEIHNYLEKTLNMIGSFHHPMIAEISRLEIGKQKYSHGIAIEIDDSPFMYISLKKDNQGFIKELFIHREGPAIYDVEFSGVRPGFDVARYKSNQECLWTTRIKKVEGLSKIARPHFVAVIHESQEPTQILSILDELTKEFDGSTCELHVMHQYPVINVGMDGQHINYQTSADKAINEMGTAGLPTVGVMLNGECIRPGYRSWQPEDVLSDLIRMGLPRKHEKSDPKVPKIA